MSRGEQLADRVRAFARPWEVAVFIWLPAIGLAFTCWYEAHAKKPLEDFGIFRSASKLVLHGHSPFPAATLHGVAHFDKFVYPPATALLFAPLAELPLWVGRVLMLILGGVAILGALRLLGVRDWRCYGITLLSTPAINSLALGAVTSFLLLGAAATWHYRSRPAAAGTFAALSAVFKVLLWPLGVWLLATRRWKAAAIAAVVAVVVTLGGWAVIGFADLRTYPRLLHVLSQSEQGVSYSPIALLRLSGSAATALSAVLVLLVASAVVLAARGRDGDRRSFAVAAIGAVVATPIVWEHYLLLLLVPIALYRPRMSPIWLLPLLLWASPATHSQGSLWRIAFLLAATALVTIRTVAGDQTDWLVSWGRKVPRPRRLQRSGTGVAAPLVAPEPRS
jgi:hypothetical protein